MPTGRADRLRLKGEVTPKEMIEYKLRSTPTVACPSRNYKRNRVVRGEQPRSEDRSGGNFWQGGSVTIGAGHDEVGARCFMN